MQAHADCADDDSDRAPADGQEAAPLAGVAVHYFPTEVFVVVKRARHRRPVVGRARDGQDPAERQRRGEAGGHFRLFLVAAALAAREAQDGETRERREEERRRGQPVRGLPRASVVLASGVAAAAPGQKLAVHITLVFFPCDLC